MTVGENSEASAAITVPATDPPPIESRGRRYSRRAGAGLLLLFVLVVQLDGMWLQTLAIAMLGVLPLAIVARLVLGVRRKLEWRLLTAPLAPGLGAHRVQWAIRGAFWLLAGVVIWSVFPVANQTPEDQVVVRGLYLGAGVLLALLELVQPRRVHWSANVVFAVALLLLAFELSKVGRVPTGPTVTLAPPFRGRWTVFHGGMSTLINHHAGIEAQAHALDLIVDNHGSPEPEEKLESYAAWGQPLLAPADGVVVAVKSDLPDQPIGGSDVVNLVGNHVVLRIAPERFVLLAHLQNSSVTVKVGDHVKRGDALARAGNSGNTSEPHLHLQVQNRAGFNAPDLRTFPILWQTGALSASGKPLPAPAYVRRNDLVDGGAP